MRILFSLLLAVNLTGASAQLTYGKSSYNEVGEAGTMVTPQLKIKNEGLSTVAVFLNRFYQNLPPNWTQCFCFISCHPPAQDSLYFTIAAGQTATIGVGFNSDADPGVGYMRLTVEVIGGSQKDTLNFSGSTYLLAGINEHTVSKYFSLYPNPFTSKVVISSPEDCTLFVTDVTGKVIMQAGLPAKESQVLNLESYPVGEYFIKVCSKSGKTEVQKIIKHQP